jgi:hypothetical protein
MRRTLVVAEDFGDLSPEQSELVAQVEDLFRGPPLQ